MRQPSRVDWGSVGEFMVILLFCALVVGYVIAPAPTPDPDLTEVIAHSVRNSNDIAELKRRVEKLEASKE